MANSKDGKRRKRRPATDVVHLGRDPAAQHGFVNTPVYRGSTVLFPTLHDLHARTQPYTYGRRATPTTRALEEALTSLAGGAETILTSSGLCAVSTALLAFVEAGDHILMADTVYQPTRAFCDRMLTRLGVETTY
ncbi:MAG: PLP-dependent transferase, partial [Hyphomicrobium sp.]